MSRKNDDEKSRKRNVISELIELYDIKSSRKIYRMLWKIYYRRNNKGDMLTSELSQHLGYNECERSTNTNSRNRKKQKWSVVSMEKYQY